MDDEDFEFIEDFILEALLELLNDELLYLVTLFI